MLRNAAQRPKNNANLSWDQKTEIAIFICKLESLN